MNFHIAHTEPDTRLDVYLSKEMETLSRSRIQSLIKDGHITVDGRKARAHMMLHHGMNIQVNVPPPRPSTFIPL